MKQILAVQQNNTPHWVGDGFPVRSLFSYHNDSEAIDPFLLLDYAGPHEFSPGEGTPRGVGAHPHRGFETVTIVYEGELEHRDSAGHSGKIGAGDVQWMTAAAGLLHEEFHSDQFNRTGGTLEMVQLWVNLAAKDKSHPPRYQDILSRSIPTVTLPDGAGTARVIAGEFAGVRGPAQTFSPIHLWDLRLEPQKEVVITVKPGDTTLLVVQRGKVNVNQQVDAQGVELIQFARQGETILLHAHEPSMVLVLSGTPLNELVVGQGPFVMNTRDEIRQAILDFKAGAMGVLD